MLTLNQAMSLLSRVEHLESRSAKVKSAKGFQVRTVLLLLTIMAEEGENQVHYREKYDYWTVSSMSVNTKTLVDYGFIIAGDDERDPRGSSKRLYLAEGVQEYLEELLGIEG